jgi:hypothetical protein
MNTQPTKLQQVAQRNGNGPRVPRLPADRQAIADVAAARILRLSPGRHRNLAPIPINGNSVEGSRAECLCAETARVYCPACAPHTYGERVAMHRGEVASPRRHRPRGPRAGRAAH